MSNLPHFDELLKLAQENPEALEKLRQEQVEQLINNAPIENQQRLRGLQFQIDAQRSIHKGSAIGSCVKISKMMHQSFGELRGWLNQLSDQNDPLREYQPQTSFVAHTQGCQENTADATKANVLSFPLASQ